MKIQIMSDVHNEFGILDVPVTPNEKDTILVLAGDIGVVVKKHTYVSFIEEMSERFKHIIYVCGNHEFWHGTFSTTVPKLRKNLEHIDNISILDRETKIIDDVAFIGATLWTDFNNNDVMAMLDAKLTMRDYKRIRSGPPKEPWKRKLEPVETLAAHQRSKEFIFDEIVEHKQDGKKVIVVVHHGISHQSIPEYLKGDPTNCAYMSELTNDILDLEDNKPELIIHGHIHASLDYNIDTTRVIVNPRGYHAVETNNKFDPTLRIEV